MRPASSLLAITLCFGAGLGLAPMLQTAHACKCDLGESRELVLVEVAGEGSPDQLAQETAAWPSEAGIRTSYAYPLVFVVDFETYLDLEVAP